MFRSDNGGEYIGPFDAYCREHGIQHQKTSPKTPQLNGLAERMNRTLVERVRCLLSHAGLHASFWGEALNTAVHVINLTPCVICRFDVPDSKKLAKSFAMKRLGQQKNLGHWIFAIEVPRSLHISQEQYIEKVLRRFNVDKAKVVSFPLTPNFKLTDKDCPSSKKNIEKMDRVPYASAVGSLMYDMVCTRPDLAHAVGVVSRFLSNPGKKHWEAVKWIFRYLRGTSKLGITFGNGKPMLVGYTDSDLAGNKDNMKSTSGYLMTFAGGAVSWQSRLQKCVALSTTEAEYVAATEACKELLWLKRFLQELGFKQQRYAVLCDNQSTIHLAKNSMFHKRTKHIDIRYHWIRDAIEDGMFELNKVHTDDNASDMLTKAVAREKEKRVRKEKKKKIFGVLITQNPAAVFRRSPEFAPSDRHDFWTEASLHIKEGFDRWDLDFEAWKFCFLPGQIASCLVIFFLSCSLFVAIYLDIDSKIMMIVVHTGLSKCCQTKVLLPHLCLYRCDPLHFTRHSAPQKDVISMALVKSSVLDAEMNRKSQGSTSHSYGLVLEEGHKYVHRSKVYGQEQKQVMRFKAKNHERGNGDITNEDLVAAKRPSNSMDRKLMKQDMKNQDEINEDRVARVPEKPRGFFSSCNKRRIVHTITLPKQNTVEDMIKYLKTKVAMWAGWNMGKFESTLCYHYQYFTTTFTTFPSDKSGES
ncbi:putative RNA-directed DNA polymerase [Tanacetum coccineum]